MGVQVHCCISYRGVCRVKEKGRKEGQRLHEVHGPELLNRYYRTAIECSVTFLHVYCNKIFTLDAKHTGTWETARNLV